MAADETAATENAKGTLLHGFRNDLGYYQEKFQLWIGPQAYRLSGMNARPALILRMLDMLADFHCALAVMRA